MVDITIMADSQQEFMQAEESLLAVPMPQSPTLNKKRVPSSRLYRGYQVSPKTARWSGTFAQPELKIRRHSAAVQKPPRMP